MTYLFFKKFKQAFDLFKYTPLPLPRKEINSMSEEAADKQDKRQILMDTAERLFAERGFEAVSVRELAAEAGVNLAMVSYYFGSKEGLFEAIIENKIPRTRYALEHLVKSDLTPWEKLSQTIDIYVDKMLSTHTFSRVIMREMSLQQRPEFVTLIANQIRLNMEIIRGFMREGMEKGHFRYVDEELTLATIFGTISTMVHSPPLVCSMISGSDAKTIFSEAHRSRLKTHLKAVLQAHLRP